MSETGTIKKTPWHLWAIGIFSLLWNAMGAFDFMMTQTKNAAYMSAFSQEQLDYFYGFPFWVVLFWAIAVWGSLLGSITLLFRKKISLPIFVASFLAMMITAFYNFGLTEGLEIMGTAGAIFTIVIFLISLLLVVYTRFLVKGGFLA